MDRAWAPEEDASLPEEDVVEQLAVLEDGEIDGEEEEVQVSPPPAASKASLSDAPAASPASAVGADDVAVTSKFAALRWIWRASAEVE